MNISFSSVLLPSTCFVDEREARARAFKILLSTIELPRNKLTESGYSSRSWDFVWGVLERCGSLFITSIDSLCESPCPRGFRENCLFQLCSVVHLERFRRHLELSKHSGSSKLEASPNGTQEDSALKVALPFEPSFTEFLEVSSSNCLGLRCSETSPVNACGES